VLGLAREQIFAALFGGGRVMDAFTIAFRTPNLLRDLFADPALAADKRYADVLRGYLGAETIGPLPLRRLAAVHPRTVNAVFRKVLRQPDFTWAEHGEALLRRRKPWYHEHEPRPDICVLGARLSELLRQ